MYYFSYDHQNLLSRIHGETWYYPWTSPGNWEWEYGRDQHGNINYVKTYGSYRLDTLIERVWYNWTMPLTRSVRKISGALVDTGKFVNQSGGFAIISSNFSGWVTKMEFFVSQYNIDSIRTHQGGGDLNNHIFSNSWSSGYTYDQKLSPLFGRGILPYGGMFGDEWMSHGKNNILTGAYVHNYTYHANGRPLTDTIVRGTGDTIRVYYKYE